jgi:hypothetical protein
VNKSFARRPVAARVCALLGVLWCSSCTVYDPELLDERSTRGEIRARAARQEMPDAAVDEPEASESDAAYGCGDGVVSEAEACDIAIARGNPGACPDGCSGGQGCLRNVLDGAGCQARCVVIELTEAASGDDCCPAGTDYFVDSDCPARCGNNELEPGEMCDPADTCPSESACVSTNACVIAHYVGAAASCDARCDVTQIHSCVSGDSCCPAGCDYAHDRDCPAPCPEGAACPMTQLPASTPDPPAMRPPPPPPPPPFVCGDSHKGSACRACDCAKCGSQVEACLNDQDTGDAMFCGAAIDCSETNKCNANQCYCGTANADACADAPRGVCLPQWQDAARTTRPSTISFLIRTSGYTLYHAAAVIDCRAQNCSKECGITP